MACDYIRVKDWMYVNREKRTKPEFIEGVASFMNFAQIRRFDLIRMQTLRIFLSRIRVVSPMKKLGSIGSQVRLYKAKNEIEVSVCTIKNMHGQSRGVISANNSTKETDDKGDKIITPQELVHFYDLRGQSLRDLLQSLRDLSDSCGFESEWNLPHASFAEGCLLDYLVFQADRHFYLAKAYSSAGKRVESYALFCRARSLADTALQKLHTSSNPDKDYGSYVRGTLLVLLGENTLLSWVYWMLVSFVSKVIPYAGNVIVVCDGGVSGKGGYGGAGFFVLTEEGELLMGGALKMKYKGTDSTIAELMASGATFDICSFLRPRGSKFVNDNIVPIKIMQTGIVKKPEIFELATKTLTAGLFMRPLAIQASCTLLADHLAEEGKEAEGDHCFNFGDKDYCVTGWYEGDGSGNIYRREAGKKTFVLADAKFIKIFESTLYAIRNGGWKNGKKFSSFEKCVARTLSLVGRPYLDSNELILDPSKQPTSKTKKK